jgi:ParB family chromosome partitioning protein
MAKAKHGSAARRAAPKRRVRKAPAGSRGLAPAECRIEELPAQAREVRERVQKEGGVVLGAYYDPLGKHPLLLAMLPLEKVAPTPFQRDVSDMHQRRLADVIHKTGLFLDPIIAITAPKEGFWTPNGGHRLAAMQRLGARAITALVVPRREVAWQILALNTEKAHTLRERATEVLRIYRDLLAEDGSRPESAFAFYLEEASLATLGLCYEARPRFSGGAYNPVVRRLETFLDEPLARAFRVRERHAGLLLDLDERVSEVVAKLKARGLTSPYLRSFVVARVNPLRWIKDEPPPLEEVLKTMRERAARFNVEKIRQEDLAAAGGAPEEAEPAS